MTDQEKHVAQECINIIRQTSAHSSVYTTYDNGVAQGVKEDIIQAICKTFGLQYQTQFQYQQGINDVR